MVYLVIPILLLAGMTMGTANKVQAEDTPYYGKEYSQPDQVLNLYPAPERDLATPAFMKDNKAFTTQEEMLQFIHKLEKESDNITIKNIGTSIEDRSIPAMFFAEDGKYDKHKPTVWLQGQIHGNEPAAGEGVLATMQSLAGSFGDNVLSKINVIVVPRVNPDGSYAFDRHAANGLDANRDHIKFDLPEVKAIHQLHNQYRPEVTIDAHEYSVGNELFSDLGEEGYLKYHDITILSGKNLNIPQEIRDVSNDLFIDNAQEQLKEKGYSSRNYYVTGRDDEDVVIKEGGTDPRIGRNAFGLTPSISFLVESRGIGIGRENFARRVASQQETHESIIETTAQNAKEIKKLVWNARKDIVKKGFLARDNDEIIVEDKRAEQDNETLEVVDIAKGDTKDIPVQYFSSSDAIPTLTRERPQAYFIDKSEKEVIEKLKLSGVHAFQLPFDVNLNVEAYKVTSKEDGGFYEGYNRTNVQTDLSNKRKKIEKGTYVVPTAQVSANLAAIALEPESDDSYVTFNIISSAEGETLPIYRYHRDQAFQRYGKNKLHQQQQDAGSEKFNSWLQEKSKK